MRLVFIQLFLGYSLVINCQSLTINVVGDLMLGNALKDSLFLDDNLSQKLFSNVKKELLSGDFTTGNLEGIYQNGGFPTKRCIEPKFCYSFRTPPSYLKSLVDAGFDAVSLSNNHILDFGYKGIDSTRFYLNKYKIGKTGILSDTFYIKNCAVGKICQISLSSYPLSFNFSDKGLIKNLIAIAKKRANVVVLVFHGGSEGPKYQHIPRSMEVNLGVNHGDLVELARYCVDSGADLVVGAGPHVLRGMELYKNRLIAYSLGNFCTHGGINISGQGGIGGILKVTLNTSGEFVHGQFISTQQQLKGIPVLDEQHQGAKVISELSKFDFPESQLKIAPNGQLTKANENNLRNPQSGRYYVIFGSFKGPNNAFTLYRKLKGEFEKLEVIHVTDDKVLYFKVALLLNKKEDYKIYKGKFNDSWIQKF